MAINHGGEQRGQDRNLVTVRVGEQEGTFDEAIAPLMEEVWKAEIETIDCDMEEKGLVCLGFPTERDIVSFLEIVAVYEAGKGSLYNRILERFQDGQGSQNWHVVTTVSDLSLHEQDDPDDETGQEWHEGVPTIRLLYYVWFPLSDVPILQERIREHNQLHEWAEKSLQGASRFSAERLLGQSANEPLRSECELCHRRFQDWDVSDEHWHLIPAGMRSLVLCEEDYRRLVRAAGHDTGTIPISHKPWHKLCQMWEKINGLPGHFWKIHLANDGEVPGETLWCEVLCKLKDGLYAVRLQNSSIFHPKYREGRLYKAAWDWETFHRSSGRPLLQARDHLRKIPS